MTNCPVLEIIGDLVFGHIANLTPPLLSIEVFVSNNYHDEHHPPAKDY
jgi:hypothetical protein